MAIKNPLTHRQLVEMFNDSEDGFISVDVEVELNAIIDDDLEGFLDLLCELVGSPFLQNIDYQVSGYAGDNMIIITVTADASEAVTRDE